jgi:phosphonate transport system permease protein
MNPTMRTAPTRDPAWQGRVFWMLALAVVLWPLGVATEFKPWVLLEPDNLKISAQFIGSFWPLVHDSEFMLMVAKETWRTVAMATAGVTLALLVAIPLTLINTRVLSVSALSGRMARGPFWLRQAVRWLLILLAQHPRTGVGAGVRAGGGPGAHRRRAGDCAHLRRHAGQGVRRDSGKRRVPRHHRKPCCATAAPACRRFSTVCCRQTPPNSPATPCTAGNARSAASVVLGFVGAGGLGQQLDATR